MNPESEKDVGRKALERTASMKSKDVFLRLPEKKGEEVIIEEPVERGDEGTSPPLAYEGEAAVEQREKTIDEKKVKELFQDLFTIGLDIVGSRYAVSRKPREVPPLPELAKKVNDLISEAEQKQLPPDAGDLNRWKEVRYLILNKMVEQKNNTSELKKFFESLSDKNFLSLSYDRELFENDYPIDEYNDVLKDIQTNTYTLLWVSEYKRRKQMGAFRTEEKHKRPMAGDIPEDSLPDTTPKELLENPRVKNIEEIDPQFRIKQRTKKNREKVARKNDTKS